MEPGRLSFPDQAHRRASGVSRRVAPQTRRLAARLAISSRCSKYPASCSTGGSITDGLAGVNATGRSRYNGPGRLTGRPAVEAAPWTDLSPPDLPDDEWDPAYSPKSRRRSVVHHQPTLLVWCSLATGTPRRRYCSLPLAVLADSTWHPADRSSPSSSIRSPSRRPCPSGRPPSGRDRCCRSAEMAGAVLSVFSGVAACCASASSRSPVAHHGSLLQSLRVEPPVTVNRPVTSVLAAEVEEDAVLARIGSRLSATTIGLDSRPNGGQREGNRVTDFSQREWREKKGLTAFAVSPCYLPMPRTGLEPAHPCEYQALNLARLPIPPPRRDSLRELSGRAGPFQVPGVNSRPPRPIP